MAAILGSAVFKRIQAKLQIYGKSEKSSAYYLLGSLSKDDGDGNGNENGKNNGSVI